MNPTFLWHLLEDWSQGNFISLFVLKDQLLSDLLCKTLLPYVRIESCFHNMPKILPKMWRTTFDNCHEQQKRYSVRTVYTRENKLWLELGVHGRINGTTVKLFPTKICGDLCKLRKSSYKYTVMFVACFSLGIFSPVQMTLLQHPFAYTSRLQMGNISSLNHSVIKCVNRRHCNVPNNDYCFPLTCVCGQQFV